MSGIEDMAQWAAEHAIGGRKAAGWRRIKNEFSCSRTEADNAANAAIALVDIPAEAERTPMALMRENRQLRGEIQHYQELERLYAEIFAELQPALPAYQKGERELPKATGRKRPCVMMLDVSDWQVGLHVRPEDTMHLGGYSFEIFLERLRRLRNIVLIVHEEQIRVRPIEALYINSLGDLLEGVGVYRGQAWFTDLQLQEQFHKLITYFGLFVRDLGVRIPQVIIRGVWGNHGRLGMKGENPPRLNAEYMLLLEIQRYVRQLQGVDMAVSLCPLLVFDCMGEVHVLAHGDKTQGWAGIPFYGLARDTLRYVNLLELPVRYLHYGHHHRKADWSESATEILLNGAMCGPTLLAVDDMKSAEVPKQRLFVVHPEHGIAWECAIKFEQRQRRIADVNGIYTPVATMAEVPDMTVKEW